MSGHGKPFIDELFGYWDYKLTLFVIGVVVLVSLYVMYDHVYLDDPSVYSREGVIAEVVSCGGSLNSKSIIVKDFRGHVIAWGEKSCEDVNERLIGGKYKAYFSENQDPENPIYLKVDEDVYFEPGFGRSEFGAIFLLSLFFSFFGSLFVLKRRRKRAEGENE